MITRAKTRRQSWLCLSGLLVFLSSIHTNVLAAPAKKARPPSPVSIAIASKQSLAPVAWVSGTVISRKDARIAAEVEGRLLNVADVGTSVQTDDVLAQLDKTFTREILAENHAEAASQKARLDLTNKDVKRLSRLASQNAAARNQLDQAISDRDVASSALASAESRIRQAHERMQRSTIKAPFAGIVSERYLQAGEWAESGSAIVRLVSVNDLEIQVRVPADYLSFIEQGTELQFSHGKQQGAGVIRTLVPVGDDTSRLYELRLVISGNSMRPGHAVRVAVPTADKKTVIAIPRDALVLRRDGIKVFVIDDQNKARAVVVSTGVARDNLIEVIGGIHPGDRVVIRGGERLRPGMQVKIKGDNKP